MPAMRRLTPALAPGPAADFLPQRLSGEPGRRLVAWAALAAMLVCAIVIATAAATNRPLFVPAAQASYPDWLRGPLDGLGGVLSYRMLIVLMIAMYACHLVVVRLGRSVSLRVAVGAIVALHVVVLLAPPLLSADVFGYLDYGRP